MKYEFGFIGCGNMGGAIARAVSKSGVGRMALYDVNKDKAKELALEICAEYADINDLVCESRYIVLGVKPQVMDDVVGAIAPTLAKRDTAPVIVTMAAGIKMETITKYACGEYPVIRIMPNTPASIGEGMILYASNKFVGSEDLEDFEKAMAESGVLDKIPESLIDAASAVSGCGPAFVCMMIEAMADGGVECGLPRNKAIKYASQTFVGTAKLLMETKKHPGELKDAVCSPSGTTIKGVHAFESSKVRAGIINAVCAAYEKSVEMSKR